MKGYCKCGEVMDEVEYTQFGMCSACYSTNEIREAYNRGYSDALFDYNIDDNDGDHEPYIMEDDYD